MAAKIRESVQQARRIAELSREYIDEVVTKVQFYKPAGSRLYRKLGKSPFLIGRSSKYMVVFHYVLFDWLSEVEDMEHMEKR